MKSFYGIVITSLIYFSAAYCGTLTTRTEKALALLDNGNYEEAISILKKEIEIDSTNKDIRVALGNALCHKANSYDQYSSGWFSHIYEAQKHYSMAVGLDSTFFDALYFLGVLKGVCADYKNAANLLGQAYYVNPGHHGALLLAYRYKLAGNEYQAATEYFKYTKTEAKLSNSRWEKAISKELISGKYIIIKNDNTRGFEDVQNQRGTVIGARPTSDTFQKYARHNYSDFLFADNKYYYKKTGIGWVPRDKQWFRGVFEEADYSDEANVYITPRGARYDKSSIRNLKRMNETTTTQSAGGIVTEGWYKVTFDLPTRYYIRAEDVAIGFGDDEIDPERIDILYNNQYWGNSICKNLLDCRLTEGITDLMAEAAVGTLTKHEIRPLRGILKETFLNDFIKLEFEDGELKSWAPIKPQSKGKLAESNNNLSNISSSKSKTTNTATKAQVENVDPNIVKDIDGNVYKTIKIGNQWWMAENLKVTHYRNGEEIPNVVDCNAWGKYTKGAYCNYGNNESNAEIFGRLYNFYTVKDSRGLAPAGWHVPSMEEWQTMINYLGGDEIAGGKMKETGIAHWNAPNTGATNESEFTALPGGYRGVFRDNSSIIEDASMGIMAYFWSATEPYENLAKATYLSCKDYDIGGGSGHGPSQASRGYSVRCIKD